MEIRTLSQQFREHATYMLGYSPDTTRRYRLVIQILQRMMSLEHIEQCTEPKIREFFYRGRVERHWTPSTFVTYRKSLVVFFRWCVRHGHLTGNPTDGIELPKIPKSLPGKLNQSESERLLDVVRNYPYPHPFLGVRNHAIFATFLLAGPRMKELLRLQCVDVDVENRSLFIRRGKGSKDRVISMNVALVGILERYRGERVKLGKTCPEFFASLTRDRGLSCQGLRRLIAFAGQVTGTPFTAHKLRHTFATLMLEGGCDIFSLSKMMGHSDIKTTTIYLAASTQHLRAQVAKHPLNQGF